METQPWLREEGAVRERHRCLSNWQAIEIFEIMKRVANISDSITVDDFRLAILSAARGHHRRSEVRQALADLDGEARRFWQAYKDGSCMKMISYRKIEKVNNNGKRRKIDSPSWPTRVFQHLIILKLEPIYQAKDNRNGLNCKKGCGITARRKRLSVLHRLKHIFYDKLHLQWAVVADQRQCYAHVTVRTFRRALRMLIDDDAFVDFAVAFTMVGGRLPIGTPLSPLAHHVVMLEFDIFVRAAAGDSLRYADDNVVFTDTREEAQQLKWRIKNFWWYRLNIRAKRHTVRVVSVDRVMDFCGYTIHRGGGGHSKGYVGLRTSILQRARRATNKNWGSYFGIMQHADMYALMKRIEKEMKLSQLTNTIRLTRRMDAPNLPIRDAVGQTMTVVDYELRCDKQGNPDWVKMLVGIPDDDGRVTAREIHGSFQFIVEFLWRSEQVFGKDAMLPLEDVVIDNQCGYIFRDSTNQIKYIENYEKK